MSGRRNSKCEVWSQQRVWADSWGRDPATGRTSNPRLGEGPVSRNYTEEVGKEPDYIGRQEAGIRIFFNLFTFN